MNSKQFCIFIIMIVVLFQIGTYLIFKLGLKKFLIVYVIVIALLSFILFVVHKSNSKNKGGR